MLIRIFYLILFLLSASITCSTEEDPEASELGQNYNIVIETKNLKAYDTSSSIDVVARIAQKEKEITLTEEATVKLVYMCKVNGNEESQQVELIIGKNSSSGTVSIDDLPVMQSEQIHCVIEAEADIDGIKYTGDNKFDIFHLDENLERKITPLDVEIKIVNLDIEEESSILDVKLYLLRNGTRIEEGSYAFADKVELQLSYDCDYGEYGAGSGSIVTLTRGEGEALVTGLPGSNDDIVSCILKVEGGLYYNDTYGSNSATKEVDISGGGKLDVTVTEAVVGNELKYTVSKNRQALSRNQLPSSSSLWLSNRHCMIDRLFLPEEKHRVYFLETVNSTTMQGNYFLLDTLLSIIENKSLGEGDKGCLLRAKFKESDVISVGASTFDVTDRKVEAPFTLNKSNATLSAASKYTGKVWVFENGSGTGLRYYSPIAAYLNASNMTAATKLKASADDNAGAATLAASQAYIVFAEVNGVLHVFPM